MVKRFFILLSVPVIFFACKKENKETYQNSGVITGIDKRLCPCLASCPCSCGTLQFHFTDTTYTSNIPLDNPNVFNLPADAVFPVYVKVNWVNTTRCGTIAIRITAFKFR